MSSETLPAFWAAYARLSEPHRQGARKAFALWTVGSHNDYERSFA